MLGNLLPITPPLVSSVGIGSSFEQMRIYVEIIPREIVDVVCETVKDTSERCRLINDSVGYKSLHDAVLDAERICSSVLCNIEPENLLFIFGQTLQSLGHAPIECPAMPPVSDNDNNVGRNRDGKEGNGYDKGKPKHRAIVLCKLRHTDALKELAIWKDEDSCHYAERYQIAWSELQELKKRFSDFGRDHLKGPNVF